MEVYFKDLISDEASLERLVEELTLVVHGADDLVQSLEANLPPDSRAEIFSRLDRLKQNCIRVRDEIVLRAKQTDKAVRANPYIALGIATLAGLLIGMKIRPGK